MSNAQVRAESSHQDSAPREGMTELIRRAGLGDRTALDALFPLVYAELRRVAERQLAQERDGHTLSPTALVHELFLRVAAESGASWENRAHFFATAATAMRRVLIDHARRQHAVKRGAGAARLPIDDITSLPIAERSAWLLSLDESLDRLAALDARQAKVVECRFFGGLSEEETAAALNVGLRTVKRDWSKARAWLFADIYSDAP
jgi:RNA polymerase sigma factor (TIGR02999 family)